MSFDGKTQKRYKNKEKGKKERERDVLRIVFLTLKKCRRVSQNGLFSPCMFLILNE